MLVSNITETWMTYFILSERRKSINGYFEEQFYGIFGGGDK